MILDATAGNRTMWKKKDSENIVYLDMQTTLERPPNIIASNEQTPFPDKTFDTIFYDPPHSWGTYTHYHSYTHRSEEYMEKWDDDSIPRYYGWDVYKDKRTFIVHMTKTNKELARILKKDGLLWLKWNEMKLQLYTIEGVFSLFETLMRIYVGSPSQTAGKHQTFWVCMQKKEGEDVQSSLLGFTGDEELSEPVSERPKSRRPALDNWLRRPS